MVWACERLGIYLIGRRFRLVTDNRAVQLLFGNSASTGRDEKLRLVKKHLSGAALTKDEWKRLERMKAIIDEFSVAEDGIVLRDTRIVVPQSLQQRTVEIAHEGHLGASKTKALMRSKVWFSGLDEMVERAVRSCHACQLEGREEAQEAVKSSKLPERVWDELAVDFLGLPNGRELLVVIDEFSRFPIVEEVATTAAQHVTPRLDDMFAVLGIPSVLKSDNGPPFNGHLFAEFCERNGIRHRKTTPEHPQSNGLVESFMKVLGKAIRRAVTQRTEWRDEVRETLRAYRSTPHLTTGKAPAELFFRRSTTTRLPESGVTASKQADDEKVRARDAEMKAKSASNSNRRRRAGPPDPLRIGDIVLAKRKRTSKWQTRFGEDKWRVSGVKGTMVTAVDADGRELTRDRTWFKRYLGEPERKPELKPAPDLRAQLASFIALEELRRTDPEPEVVSDEQVVEERVDERAAADGSDEAAPVAPDDRDEDESETSNNGVETASDGEELETVLDGKEVIASGNESSDDGVVE